MGPISIHEFPFISCTLQCGCARPCRCAQVLHLCTAAGLCVVNCNGPVEVIQCALVVAMSSGPGRAFGLPKVILSYFRILACTTLYSMFFSKKIFKYLKKKYKKHRYVFKLFVSKKCFCVEVITL